MTRSGSDLRADPLAGLIARLEELGRGGRGANWQCPAHDDKNPSLSIGRGQDGRALINCHAGCALSVRSDLYEEVIAADELHDATRLDEARAEEDAVIAGKAPAAAQAEQAAAEAWRALRAADRAAADAIRDFDRVLYEERESVALACGGRVAEIQTSTARKLAEVERAVADVARIGSLQMTLARRKSMTTATLGQSGRRRRDGWRPSTGCALGIS